MLLLVGYEYLIANVGVATYIPGPESQWRRRVDDLRMFLVALKLSSADNNKTNLHLLVCRQLEAIGNPAFIPSAAPVKLTTLWRGTCPARLVSKSKTIEMIKLSWHEFAGNMISL